MSDVVDVAEVLIAFEGKEVTRDVVVDYLYSLTDGTSTEISSIQVNEVLKMLGISEVVVDADLIMDMLA